MYGKGAGRFPTASAVLSDISALRYQYKYEYRKAGTTTNELTTNFYVRVYVSFDLWSDVDLKAFEWIDEFYCQEQRQFLVGVIHFEKLQAALWRHKKGVSIILCPDGIIEEVTTRAIKKKSLALAGANDLEKTAYTIQNLPEELLAI